jgi:hypothetical protein
MSKRSSAGAAASSPVVQPKRGRAAPLSDVTNTNAHLVHVDGSGMAHGFICKPVHANKFMSGPNVTPKTWEIRTTRVKCRVPGETIYIFQKSKVDGNTVWMATAKGIWAECKAITDIGVLRDNQDKTLTSVDEIKASKLVRNLKPFAPRPDRPR